MNSPQIAPGPQAHDVEVDVLVVGSGTGMAAALAAHEKGLTCLIVEKTEYVGGSTARSGGAFWVPANSTLARDGATDTTERAESYLEAVVRDVAPAERWHAYLDHGRAAIDMVERTTGLEFFWAKGYSDYHPENPGGSAVGRTCESKPYDASALGEERSRFRPGLMEAPVPMPVTGADYKWMNLVARKPMSALPRIGKRVAQGIGGKAVGREYVAGGQAIAAGLFAGVTEAGIPVWTRTSLVSLTRDAERVTGATVEQDGRTVTVTARRGVILATGGFEHNVPLRREHGGAIYDQDYSLGSEGNTGDGIFAGQDAGADLAFMDQAWWFPAIAPVGDGPVQVLLAERSLPGSLIVNERGERFINESTDYMTFGQTVLAGRTSGEGPRDMWMVFDQRYRDSYVLAGAVFPRQGLPQEWLDAGIAHRGDNPRALADAIGVPGDALLSTLRRFNALAANGNDEDFHRGASAYDRYYGDPTQTPNPCLRPLRGGLYAVKVVVSDLGTCGGLKADERARVLRPDGSAIEGLYAIGNTAGNAFGDRYPGAGATIGQGLVFGYIAALDAAGALESS
ncbi:3-ketosteroid-delta-1-dehydrogenase [Demequina flava]|uniref:3-ketosteroid-delta-1-dehydrogenase n=1 Tax=Demequina flava TaxID=1095025 RepID=UPI0007860EFA|nr:3-ketosteroid-delta-1-dehydrogenase [Demequina flava]